jgi:uncharacterized membrane protein YozB (DUF420 family)
MALVSALVLSKVILIGELLKPGSRFQHRPLLIVAVYKAAVFTVFYLFFHLLESGIRGVLHGEPFLQAVHAEAFTRPGRLAIRMLFVFFAFIPFFALLESRHVIGEERFRHLFFGVGRHSPSHEDGGRG